MGLLSCDETTSRHDESGDARECAGELVVVASIRTMVSIMVVALSPDIVASLWMFGPLTMDVEVAMFDCGLLLLLLDSGCSGRCGRKRSMSCGFGPETGRLRFFRSSFRSDTFIFSNLLSSVCRLKSPPPFVATFVAF